MNWMMVVFVLVAIAVALYGIYFLTLQALASRLHDRAWALKAESDKIHSRDTEIFNESESCDDLIRLIELEREMSLNGQRLQEILSEMLNIQASMEKIAWLLGRGK